MGMLIPVDKQADVLEHILYVALELKAQNLAQIVYELLKGMRVKVPAAQEALKRTFKGNDDPAGIFAQLLYLVYPKGEYAAWGWSRIGWGWQVWWQFAVQILTTLEPSAAFDELAALLDMIEGKCTTPLSQQKIWQDQDRLSKARKLLCQFGSVEEADLLACLDATLK